MNHLVLGAKDGDAYGVTAEKHQCLCWAFCNKDQAPAPKSLQSSVKRGAMNARIVRGHLRKQGQGIHHWCLNYSK